MSFPPEGLQIILPPRSLLLTNNDEDNNQDKDGDGDGAPASTRVGLKGTFNETTLWQLLNNHFVSKSDTHTHSAAIFSCTQTPSKCRGSLFRSPSSSGEFVCVELIFCDYLLDWAVFNQRLSGEFPATLNDGTIIMMNGLLSVSDWICSHMGGRHWHQGRGRGGDSDKGEKKIWKYKVDKRKLFTVFGRDGWFY